MGCKGVVYCPRRVDTSGHLCGTNPARTRAARPRVARFRWPWSPLVCPGPYGMHDPPNQPMENNIYHGQGGWEVIHSNCWVEQSAAVWS